MRSCLMVDWLLNWVIQMLQCELTNYKRRRNRSRKGRYGGKEKKVMWEGLRCYKWLLIIWKASKGICVLLDTKELTMERNLYWKIDSWAQILDEAFVSIRQNVSIVSILSLLDIPVGSLIFDEVWVPAAVLSGQLQENNDLEIYTVS